MKKKNRSLILKRYHADRSAPDGMDGFAFAHHPHLNRHHTIKQMVYDLYREGGKYHDSWGLVHLDMCVIGYGAQHSYCRKHRRTLTRIWWMDPDIMYLTSIYTINFRDHPSVVVNDLLALTFIERI